MLLSSLFKIFKVCTSFFNLNLLRFWIACLKELGMTADLGPEIPDYVDEAFANVQPTGAMVEYRDEELAADLEEE